MQYSVADIQAQMDILAVEFVKAEDCDSAMAHQVSFQMLAQFRDLRVKEAEADERRKSDLAAAVRRNMTAQEKAKRGIVSTCDTLCMKMHTPSGVSCHFMSLHI